MLQPLTISVALCHTCYALSCGFFSWSVSFTFCFQTDFVFMPHSIIHCYNCHHGILSPPFCLLSSTSFHIYPTMLQLQDFAVSPVSLTCFLSHHISCHLLHTVNKPASSIFCSFHTNSQMFWMLCSVFCAQSIFPRYITSPLCSPPWYLFWTIFSLKSTEYLLITLKKVQLVYTKVLVSSGVELTTTTIYINL